MKKTLIAAVLIAAAVLGLAGCSKAAKADEYGWYHDFDAAQNIAKRQNKNLFLLISRSGDDEDSADAKLKIFNTKEFIANVSKDFVPVNLSFTQADYQNTIAAEGATAKEQKAADKRAEQLKKDELIVNRYIIRVTPAIVLLTKEGYAICTIPYDRDITTPEAYAAVLAGKQENVKKFNDLAAAVKKGSSKEKVAAIDALYEATEEQFRLNLYDLYKQVPDLDKKNETGLLNKYIIQSAMGKSYYLIEDRDVINAAKVFADTGADERLTLEERQQMYYSAGYVLMQTSNSDYELIIGYLQSAYDVNPNGDLAPTIKQIIESVKQQQAVYGNKPAENSKTNSQEQQKDAK